MIACNEPVAITVHQEGRSKRSAFPLGARRLGFCGPAWICDVFVSPQKTALLWMPTYSREYRGQHLTREAYRDLKNAVELVADSGCRVKIEAPRYVIDHLIAECEEQEIPKARLTSLGEFASTDKDRVTPTVSQSGAAA